MIENIKMLVMDVDGTLTDGKIYMGVNEELFKAFDAVLGCAGRKCIGRRYGCPQDSNQAFKRHGKLCNSGNTPVP